MSFENIFTAYLFREHCQYWTLLLLWSAFYNSAYMTTAEIANRARDFSPNIYNFKNRFMTVKYVIEIVRQFQRFYFFFLSNSLILSCQPAAWWWDSTNVRYTYQMFLTIRGTREINEIHFPRVNDLYFWRKFKVQKWGDGRSSEKRLYALC